MPNTPNTAALLAAVEPLTAYLSRTPAPNAHADKVATMVDAMADYVELVESAACVAAKEPNWQALAYQIAAAVDLPPAPPCVLITRCRALLNSPLAHRVAALPPAQRAAMYSLNSHDLALPETL